MTLYEGVTGRIYEVQDIHLSEKNIVRRLEALGVIDLTKIQILNKKKSGACIIKVRGTRFALGKHITQGIEVREVE